MLHHAQIAHGKVRGLTREQFDADDDLRTVVTWHLMIVGEAAARIDTESQSALPQVPWRRIISMRHRLVHDYGNIDDNIVWTTATQRKPELIEQLQRYLKEQR